MSGSADLAADIAAEAEAEAAIVSASDAFVRALARYRWHPVAQSGLGGPLVDILDAFALAQGLWITEVDWSPLPTSPLVVRLANRDGWTCHYCPAALGWGHPSVTPPQIEHVLPASRGGTNDGANLVLACRPCNTSKGTQTPVEWRREPCCDAHREVV